MVQLRDSDDVAADEGEDESTVCETSSVVLFIVDEPRDVALVSEQEEGEEEGEEEEEEEEEEESVRLSAFFTGSPPGLKSSSTTTR